MFLSSGVLVAGFLDVIGSVGNSLYWLLLPMTALFVSTVVVNDKVLIPRLLLRDRYATYCGVVFVIVYAMALAALALEHSIRARFDLQMRITDYHSGWILADTFGNSLLLSIILLGLGLLHLVKRWRDELAHEASMTLRLETYMDAVSRRLNPGVILDRLQQISWLRGSSPGQIEGRVRELSAYLRQQLYELPSPPEVGKPDGRAYPHTRLAELLTARRFRLGRHLIFLGILLTISCGAFFDTPDRPVFTPDRILGVAALFGLLSSIAYADILWLYPRFMRQGNVRRYAMATVALSGALVIPIVVIQVMTYAPNVYDKELPPFVMAISTISSVMTLFLFIGGVGAGQLLQNWIMARRRLTLLRAETVRQEYAYLRKQINPHFLFNILNNIGITAYDEPEVAGRLLDGLAALLRHQLCDLRRQTTTLDEERSFITSYFALESTRRERFEYRITMDDRLGKVEVPTLLFIPFIENAVKYSSPREGIHDVEVDFRQDGGRLIFACRNPYRNVRPLTTTPGGIGVSNTLRRLSLLYDDYTYHSHGVGGLYIVKLEIPIPSYEMYHH